MPRGRRCKQVGTRADGANSADFYAAMPPSTPRMISFRDANAPPRACWHERSRLNAAAQIAARHTSQRRFLKGAVTLNLQLSSAILVRLPG